MQLRRADIGRADLRQTAAPLRTAPQAAAAVRRTRSLTRSVFRTKSAHSFISTVPGRSTAIPRSSLYHSAPPADRTLPFPPRYDHSPPYGPSPARAHTQQNTPNKNATAAPILPPSRNAAACSTL